MDDRTIAGIRLAIEWLHARANRMNDAHAQQVLHSAATNLGWDLRDVQAGTKTISHFRKYGGELETAP